MSGEQAGWTAEWTVQLNADDTGVIVGFTQMGEDGVEAFETCMPPKAVVPLAAALLNHAIELGEDLL